MTRAFLLLGACGLVGCAQATDPKPMAQTEPVAEGSDALLTVEAVTDFGAPIVNPSSSPQSYAVVGDTVVFLGATGVYASNGTRAGTRLLMETPAFFDESLFSDGRFAYWRSDSTVWRTDGTTEGTVPTRLRHAPTIAFAGRLYAATFSQGFYLLDVETGVATRLCESERSTLAFEHLGALYFSCPSASAGFSRTDGTLGGTAPVSLGGVKIRWPIGALGDRLLFMGTPLGEPTTRPFVTDFTAAGTVQLSATLSSSNRGRVNEGVVLGNALIFNCGTAGGDWLCRSDGTASGTYVLANNDLPIYSQRITAFQGKVYFQASDLTSGQELWVTDGTAAGTQRVMDLAPGSGSGAQGSRMIEHEGALYFKGSGIQGVGLYRTDGTAAGTQLIGAPGVFDGETDSYQRLDAAVALGGRLFFTGRDAHGDEPWVLEGNGLHMLADLARPTREVDVKSSLKLGGRLLLPVASSDGGVTLFSTDGSAAGTRRLSPVLAAPFGGLARVRDAAVVIARGSGPDSTSLWRSDGLTLTKIGEYAQALQAPLSVGTLAYVRNFSPLGKVGLWRTDGTTAGTLDTGMQLAYRAPLLVSRGWVYSLIESEGYLGLWRGDPNGLASLGRPLSTNIVELSEVAPAPVGDGVVIALEDSYTGVELWRASLPQGPPLQLKDINPTQTPIERRSSSPTSFTPLGGVQIFSAYSPRTGRELHVTDGTAAGTSALDVLPGTAGLFPEELFRWGSYVFFRGSTPEEGAELWRTDGTVAGTVRVADLFGGPASSSPKSFRLLAPAGPLVFIARTRATGRELWQLRTPTAVPELLTEPLPGPESSIPLRTELYLVGDKVCTPSADAEAPFVCVAVPGADGVPPSLSCPANMSVAAGQMDAGVTVSYGGAAAEDNSGVVQLTYSRPSLSEFSEGVTEVVVHATDVSGNLSVCSFTVTVTVGGSPLSDGGSAPDPSEHRDGGSPAAGSSGGAGTGSGTGVDAPDAPDATSLGRGCGCGSGANGLTTTALVAVLWVALGRRRAHRAWTVRH